MINVIAAFVLLIIVTTLLFQYTGRYVYNYKIRDTGIEIVLFGRIPIKRIPFGNIAEIRKLTFKEAFKETLPFKSIEMFTALRCGNRVWGQSVLIRQKKRIIKIILITPDNVDSFVKEVLRHLSAVK